MTICQQPGKPGKVTKAESGPSSDFFFCSVDYCLVLWSAFMTFHSVGNHNPNWLSLTPSFLQRAGERAQPPDSPRNWSDDGGITRSDVECLPGLVNSHILRTGKIHHAVSWENTHYFDWAMEKIAMWLFTRPGKCIPDPYHPLPAVEMLGPPGTAGRSSNFSVLSISKTDMYSYNMLQMVIECYRPFSQLLLPQNSGTYN